MADEVTQLPSSPREDPLSPVASPFATSPLVERETNIMTQNELDLLRESHSFPSSVQIRLLEEDETITSIRPGDDWEFPSGTSRDAGVLKVLRTWGTLGNNGDNPPVGSAAPIAGDESESHNS
ncbi:hypothetical protein Acr_01g0008600 [Actinidia rufa]|uniref:Uncharacterized protein n=1 Tax=Actinidia rufa TaxID=165716 RepID=A0A7J0E3F5_9ERIC|nr:hypothetical protein Acr_01g0008600 [Actinidia rufa]